MLFSPLNRFKACFLPLQLSGDSRRRTKNMIESTTHCCWRGGNIERMLQSLLKMITQTKHRWYCLLIYVEGVMFGYRWFLSILYLFFFHFWQKLFFWLEFKIYENFEETEIYVGLQGDTSDQNIPQDASGTFIELFVLDWYAW